MNSPGLLIVSRQMLCPYHRQQVAPLILLVLSGIGVIVATALNRGFHPILLTFIPGPAFTVFCCHCILKRERKPWHQKVWKASVWWSGIWLFCFFVGFLTPLPLFGGTFLVGLPLALGGGWCQACGINPFVAVGLHLLAWACSLDASRNEILVETD